LSVLSFCLILFSSPWKSAQYVVKAVQINSLKCSCFRVARWFDFTNFITEKKNHSNMLCYRPHSNELYTGMLNSGYFLPWTCSLKLSVERYWLKFFLSQIFLHFGQFYPYSRQVCSKGLDNWTAITDTLTLNGFSRNAKHGFDSWKWPNLAWNFPVVSKFILVFFHFVVCNCLFEKTFILILRLRKWKNAFDDMCL